MSKKTRSLDRLTVAFDFDGVITQFRNGWLGKSEIDDVPVKGIKEVIDELIEDNKIVIVSHRCDEEVAREKVIKWLDKHKIQYDEVTSTMPHNVAYIDDKAISFNGNVNNLIHNINNMNPWHNDIENRVKPGDIVKFNIFDTETIYEGEIKYEFKITNHIEPSFENTKFYRIVSDFKSFDIPAKNILTNKRVG